MKKILIGVLAGLVVGAAAAWLILRHGAQGEAAEARETAVPAEAASPLHFTPDQRKNAGIALATPAARELSPELRTYGRVLDPSAFVAAAADVATAQASLAASEKERDRARSLYEHGQNTSAQAVETAEAAAAKDRVQFNAARARLVAAWGPALAARADLGPMVDALQRGWTLARVDFSPGEAPAAAPAAMKIGLLSGPAAMADAEVLGPAPVVDPQVQGQGYFVVVRDRLLPAGAALQAVAPAAGPPERVLVVPAAAVVYHQGSAFVFILGKGDDFERRRVDLGRAVDDGYAVGGVGAADQVVVAGAQQLLSNELQAGAGAPD